MVELTEYNGENIVGLKGRQILVNESFLPQMKQLGKFASQNNLVLFVIHSYRPNGSLIINAIVNPVSLSNHQVGYAIDINIKYKRKVYTSSDLRLDNMNNLPSSICRFLVQVRECKIMPWGGDFNIPDPVHVDYPLNINNYNHFLTCKTMCTKDYTEAKRRWKF